MENETENVPPPAEAAERGVPVEVVILILGFLAIAVGGDIYFANTARAAQPGCSASDALQKSQVESQKVQLSVALEQMKSTYALQMKVAEGCITRGGTPSFQNGNVLCAGK